MAGRDLGEFRAGGEQNLCCVADDLAQHAFGEEERQRTSVDRRILLEALETQSRFERRARRGIAAPERFQSQGLQRSLLVGSWPPGDDVVDRFEVIEFEADRRGSGLPPARLLSPGRGGKGLAESLTSVSGRVLHT